MIALRPLFVVTGTIQVQGGETYEQEKQGDGGRAVAGSASFTVVQKRSVTSDRRAGNVLATAYSRRLRLRRLLKTPYGSLVAPDKVSAVKAMLDAATRDVVAFNAGKSRDCHLSNCMLLERLRGNRLAAVQGWIAKQLDVKDPDVVEALPQLVEVHEEEGGAGVANHESVPTGEGREESPDSAGSEDLTRPVLDETGVPTAPPLPSEPAEAPDVALAAPLPIEPLDD